MIALKAKARSGRSHFLQLLRGMSGVAKVVLLCGTDRAQALRHALVQANDGLRQLVHGGDERQTDGGDDQRVFHQVLPGFVAPDLLDERLNPNGESGYEHKVDFLFRLILSLASSVRIFFRYEGMPESPSKFCQATRVFVAG